MQTCLKISEILLKFTVAYKYRDLRVNVSEDIPSYFSKEVYIIRCP